MGNQEDAEDLELIKRTGHALTDLFAQTYKSLIDQIASMGRWLIASLLVINSGGALSVLNAAGRMTSVIIPEYSFIAGIMFALLSGFFQQRTAVRGLDPVAELLGRAVRAAHDGYFEGDADELAKEVRRRANRLAWTGPAAGWVSALLFLCGAVLAGFSLRAHDRQIAELCASAQDRMFSASSGDATEVFSALGCHAH